MNSVYIAPCGTSFKVCCGDRVLCTCNNYLDAWRAREAERRAAR